MATMETKLSLASLNTLIKRLETKKKSYSEVALRIVDRLADEMMNEVTYSGTYKVSATQTERGATAGIANNKEYTAFQEFGTGVIGSQFPHVAEELAKRGWQYDVNTHGENGWWYPTTESDPNPVKWIDGSGQLRAWTKGLPAGKEFYIALKRAEELFIEVGQEELEREANG